MESDGVDFVKRAFARACQDHRRRRQRQVRDRGCATLTSYDLGTDFQLAVDNGCLHGLSDEQRTAYVENLSAIVSQGGRLVVAGFLAGKRREPRGFNKAEVERRFSSGWELLHSGIDAAASNDANDPIVVYELRRR